MYKKEKEIVCSLFLLSVPASSLVRKIPDITVTLTFLRPTSVGPQNPPDSTVKMAISKNAMASQGEILYFLLQRQSFNGIHR
jgi:hypothetical protein